MEEEQTPEQLAAGASRDKIMNGSLEPGDFVSLAVVAGAAGCDDRTAFAAVALLRERGLIEGLRSPRVRIIGPNLYVKLTDRCDRIATAAWNNLTSRRLRENLERPDSREVPALFNYWRRLANHCATPEEAHALRVAIDLAVLAYIQQPAEEGAGR